MGTWGSGLWDNDSALDALPDLVRISPAKETLTLVTAWAVKLWFAQCKPAEFSKGIERKASELTKLPKPVFEELVAIVREPRVYEKKTSRLPEHAKVLGGYCDGYFIAPVFELPEVRAVVASHSEKLSLVVDKQLSRKPRKDLLYELDLTALGLVLSFTRVGAVPTKERLDAWEAGFDAIDQANTSERGFWDEWRDRVRPSFELMRGARRG